jgi:hypothetical protein
MPSLFKYFAFVGAALLGLMSLANFLLDPSTGATVVSQAPAKPAVTVEHDPRASKIERWRNEQAALRTPVTETSQTAPATTAAAKATVQTPAVQPVAAVAPEIAKPVEQAHAAVATPEAPAATPLQTSEVSAITGVQTDDERAAEAARVKAEKQKAAKARKARAAARIAREQGAQMSGNQFYGGSQQRNASNQQDQFYYSQRVPRERQSFNAYAPRQGYGPFGW